MVHDTIACNSAGFYARNLCSIMRWSDITGGARAFNIWTVTLKWAASVAKIRGYFFIVKLQHKQRVTSCEELDVRRRVSDHSNSILTWIFRLAHKNWTHLSKFLFKQVAVGPCKKYSPVEACSSYARTRLRWREPSTHLHSIASIKH